MIRDYIRSFYYLFREIGFYISGYNQIALIGKLMALTVFIFVIYLALIRDNKTPQKLLLNMLLALTAYYLLSTTVHPWYLTSLVFLAIFTNFKFPIVWSFMVVLSYLAYANSENSENLWVIVFEYIVVFAVLLYDSQKTRALEY